MSIADLLKSDQLRITNESPESLINDPDNVRTHPPRNRDAVRRSLTRFGVRKPIVAHESTRIVYAGNLTLEIAVEIGLETIPVAWIPADVPESVCKAYAIADNRTTDLSEFDDEKLAVQIQEIQFEVEPLDFVIEPLDLGFESIEIPTVTAPEADAPDDFPEFDDTTETEYECPKCAFKWSGKPN